MVDFDRIAAARQVLLDRLADLSAAKQRLRIATDEVEAARRARDFAETAASDAHHALVASLDLPVGGP